MIGASRLITAAALSLGLALLGFGATAHADEQAERLAHWQDIATLLFGDHPLQKGDGVIALDAPVRADDAALVPMTISIAPGNSIKASVSSSTRTPRRWQPISSSVRRPIPARSSCASG